MRLRSDAMSTEAEREAMHQEALRSGMPELPECMRWILSEWSGDCVYRWKDGKRARSRSPRRPRHPHDSGSVTIADHPPGSPTRGS